MADTVKQTITKAANWVEVVSAVEAGTIQNVGERTFRFQEDETIPNAADTGGHILGPGKSIQYALAGVSKLWMRSLTGDGILAITAD